MLLHGQPRRVEAVHERLQEHHAGGLARAHHPLRVGRARASGFSHSTCRHRRSDRPLGMQVVRQRDVDGVDLRAVDQRLVRAVRRADAERAGCDLGPTSSREAMATTWQRAAAWIAGITFPVPIRAGDSTPQRRSATGPLHLHDLPGARAASGDLEAVHRVDWVDRRRRSVSRERAMPT